MAGVNQIFSLADDVARYVKACGKTSVLQTKPLQGKINTESLRFAPEAIGDTIDFSNKIKWSPRWVKQGFQIPQSATKLDFTEEGLNVSQILRNEHRIPFGTKIPNTFVDGDLGVKFLDDGSFMGIPRCEIMQIDFLNDKTLIKTIENFKNILAKNANASENDKIKLLMKYVDDIFSAGKTDQEILKLTKSFPEGKVVNLGEIIDSGAGVCRHRSLLLKILGDECNMNIALVKGSYDDGHHAWNEIMTKSGKKYLVDPMHRNIVDLSNEATRDLRVLSYSQGVSDNILYATEYANTNKLYGFIRDLSNNQALSLGNKARLYKANEAFAIYPEINQKILVNGKVLDKPYLLNVEDVIEYVGIDGKPVKIIWKTNL